MSSIYSSMVYSVRKFNRFYTNILGLLDQHLLNSEFSLSEARVLYELGHMENCASKKLIEELKIDSGYLSRIMKRFEKRDLVYRVQSDEDGRLFFIYLTEKGKETLAGLDELSNRQIQRLVTELQPRNRKKLLEGMKNIEGALSDAHPMSKEKIEIRSGLRPGDIGYLIHMHGWIYTLDCGYNHMFEGYVCKTFYEFAGNYNPEKDRIWFAEASGNIVGAIAIVGHTAEKAQLRWFIIHPDFRGMGLGKKLFEGAMKYCREKGYKNIFLETTDDQKTAIHMYIKAGFKKIRENEDNSWGINHIEQTYELNLQ